MTLTWNRLEPAVVSVNQALADKGIAPWATLIGYLEVQYTWPWDALCVTVRDLDTIHSLIFTYNLEPANMPNIYDDPSLERSTVLEGLWWKQEPNVAGFVSLSNPNGDAISARVQLTDSQANILGEHTVTISPHGTKLLQLQELHSAPSNEGGLRVTWDGPENRLLVYAGLQDPATGFSARLTFHFPPPSSVRSESNTYAAIGMMGGEADPMMRFPAGTRFTPYAVLRDISDTPISVHPTLYWMEGSISHAASLPTVALSPYHSVTLNLASLIDAYGPKSFNGNLNVAFQYKGRIRALLVASGSVDQKNTYVFEVHPQLVGDSVAKAISYWSTANGDDTMVTLWNPADEEQDFVFRSFFSGGHYNFPVHLGPKATQAFNISEIIQNQVPDDEGNIIPASVHEGSAEISGPKGVNQHILVSIDAGTYNVEKATCTGFCLTCAGAVDSWVDVDPFAVAVGGKDPADLHCRV